MATPKNPYHAAAAAHKARRAMHAINELLATVFIPDPEVPEVTDRLSGLRMIHRELVGQNSPTMWVLVGNAHDLLFRLPLGTTEFRSSRVELFAFLNIAIEAERSTAAGEDPFQNLVD